MARSEIVAFLAQAESQHGLDREAIDSAYDMACYIVETQRQELERAMPDLGNRAFLRIIELWFVWGLAHELMEVTERAQVLCVWYLHKRRELPLNRACDLTLQMVADAAEGNCLFDSLADVGRLAGRDGGSGHFVKAATAVQHLLDAAA